MLNKDQMNTDLGKVQIGFKIEEQNRNLLVQFKFNP